MGHAVVDLPEGWEVLLPVDEVWADCEVDDMMEQ